jgi:hypothetical protein
MEHQSHLYAWIPALSCSCVSPLKDLLLPLLLLATSPLVDGVTGRYFEDCQEAEPNQPGIHRGVAAFALNSEHAKRLWEISLSMLSE